MIDKMRLASKTLALPIAGAAIGYASWGHPSLIWFATLIPFLWSRAPSRWTAFTTVLMYQLAGSRVIPQGAGIFFGNDTWLLVGLGMWLIASAANALPWGLFWVRPGTERRPLFMAIACGLAMFANMIPPLGIIGWLNPLIPTATLFPGMGWFAILGALGLLCGTAALAPAAMKKTVVTGLAILVVLGLSGRHFYQPVEPYNGWVGVDTELGPYPSAVKEQFKRKVFVANDATAKAGEGAKVILYPEQILGPWNDNDSRIFLESMFKGAIPQDVAIIMGGERPVTGTGFYTNSLFIYQANGWQRLDARQAVPVSMWRPWTRTGTVSYWTKMNVTKINGRETMVSICYEDFLAPLHLAAFLFHKPEAILSASNGWWTKGTDEMVIQYQHIEAIARIFGVPLITATNRA